MPTNRTTFAAANMAVTKPESVQTIYLVGDDIRNGGSYRFQVPKSLTKIKCLVFDMSTFPLTPTKFSIKDEMDNIVAEFTVSVHDQTSTLIQNNFPHFTPHAFWTMTWPAFRYACMSQLALGAIPRTTVFLMFYEDPSVVSGEVQAIAAATPRDKKVRLGTGDKFAK